jgi:Cupin-like domain
MLDESWKRWIAENKLLGISDDDITATVYKSLGSKEGVEQVLADVSASAVFGAGQLLAQRLKKLESLTRNIHKAQAIAPNARRIDRRHNLSPMDFFIDYYARNTPVIMTGLIDHWPAMSRWTLAYLKSICGAQNVEVMWGREGNADYETQSHNYKRAIPFADYVDLIDTSESNDFYIVANNGFLRSEGTQGLLEDFSPLAGFQHPLEQKSHGNFWLGPKGTVTPLHHDPSNILFMQIWGEKLFKFISPLQTPDIYNDLGVFSSIDPENPDLARYPLFANCDVIEEVIAPGDVLFIPVGWWHHVRGLSASLSLSSTSFTQPNQYVWQNPQGRY